MSFKELISLKTTGQIALVGLALLVTIHLLVILKILPSSIVWGGQLSDMGENLYLMEGISLGVTVLIMAIVIMRLRIRRPGTLKRLAVYLMWVVFVLFALSTLGNLTSSTLAETVLFTPLSVLLALVALRLAVSD